VQYFDDCMDILTFCIFYIYYFVFFLRRSLQFEQIFIIDLLLN
jgi:hypothetical protein